MTFVIAAGTNITGFGIGIQSVNVQINPQIQRLYQLGSTVPFDKNITTQTSISISRYGGQTSDFDLTASVDCTEPDPIELTITSNGCNGDAISITGDFWIQSYSYNKDVQGWGIENFTLISRPTVTSGDGAVARMIRGVAEGQTTQDGQAVTGINFISGTTQISGTTVEVSAGQPGIGRARSILFGEIDSITDTTGKADGLDGSASVSIPYTPIYIPEE